MADFNGAYRDPDGPVVVAPGVPLDLVRHPLGAARWIERPGTRPGIALLVTRDLRDADAVAACGVPAVCVVDDQGDVPEGPAARVAERALGEWLMAFDDGALITGADAEALAWVQAIRAEEERNHREGERQAFAQLEQMSAHVAAIEASRSYKLSRRMVAARDRLSRLVRRG